VPLTNQICSSLPAIEGHWHVIATSQLQSLNCFTSVVTSP
jgi:hypothetical protein